ncbi:MAG: glycosyltransferase family 4 protein [Prochloraceae cyanobacterium]|nr:glycosyltransferase family 4 protein [Prochloraceae cyanobacterium]
MRVLIYSYNYYPEPIGIAPLMTELAEGLVKRGHEVRALTAMPWYPQCEIGQLYQGKLFVTEQCNGVQIERCYVWVRPQRSLTNRALFEISFVSLSFLRALGGWSPDVILLTVPGLPVCVPAAMLGWFYRCPVILNLQDILPDAAIHVGLLTNERLINIFRALEKFAYRSATKISVIADGFTKNLIAKGVSDDKIVEIPNWVDVDFIKPLALENNYFRVKNKLEGKFVVLYSGNIALTQPLETLIDAAKELKDIEEITITIVGAEKALARLQDYREKQGLSAQKVLLLPFEPRDKLPEMLAAADVGMVMQKRDVIDFNMPSKIQVLLASGRAIIASVPATGTAARAVQNSGGGMVVPPEDPKALAEAIRKLYSDRDLVATLGQKGRQYACDNYSFESALERYEKLFATVTGH